MLPVTHGTILAVFFNATPAEIVDGAQWYVRAKDAAVLIVERYGLSLETVVGVIAALSPNNKWERNVTDADQLCRAFTLGGHPAADSIKVGTYKANKLKALRILSGEPPLSVLGGLKVRAFYGCIMGDTVSVCVDGHTYAIWMGERIPTTKTAKISPKLYAAISADYIKAAETINNVMGANYSASQIQAITWIAYRRMVAELGLYRSAK